MWLLWGPNYIMSNIFIIILSMFSAGAVYRAHPGCKVAEEQPYWLGRDGLMLYPVSFQALMPPPHHHCFQRCCHNANVGSTPTLSNCSYLQDVNQHASTHSWKRRLAAWRPPIATQPRQASPASSTQDDIARTVLCMTRPAQISTGHCKWPNRQSSSLCGVQRIPL